MAPLSREVLLLYLKLRRIAAGDEDITLLTTIPGVGYYTAVLVKAEIDDVSCAESLFREQLERKRTRAKCYPA